MTRGAKSRRSPNNLRLAQQHCEALIIGPARDSAVEKTLAVFFGGRKSDHSSTPVLIHPVSPGRSAYDSWRRGFSRARPH
jgi:hypothetical protein